MAVQLGEIIQGLQLLGGVLSLPRQVQYAEQASEQMRQNLAGTGLSEDQIAAAAPKPGLGWLSAGDGVGGKILGGVGDVGSLISAIAGKPVAPPRTSITDIAAASKLRAENKQLANQQLLVQAMAEGKSPEAVASLAVAAGQPEAGVRLYGRRGETQPWRGTPAERTRLTENEERNLRAERATRMTFRDERERQNFVEGAIMPPQADVTPALPPDVAAEKRDEGERRAREKLADKYGLQGDDRTEFILYGTRKPAPAGDTAKQVQWVRLLDRVQGEHQARVNSELSDRMRNPNLPPPKVDPQAVMSDAIERANVIEDGGGTVVGRPPRPASAGPQETGIGSSVAPTEPPDPALSPAPPPAPSPSAPGMPTSKTPPTTTPTTSTTTTTTAGPQTANAWQNMTVPAPDQMTTAQHAYFEQLNQQIEAGTITRDKAAELFVKYVHGIP